MMDNIVVVGAATLGVVAPIAAQHPVLAPTQDVSIVVPLGTLHYSSISIPAGVTVRFVAPGYGTLSVPGMPAVVLCDGDAVVHGTLSVAGDWGGVWPPNARAAGWVTTGAGLPGTLCGSGPNRFYLPPEGGRHAGSYGSVVPFSLEGGSPGGDLAEYTLSCWQWVWNYIGGYGGGTLALLARGRIEVHGTVTADGEHASTSSGGSGGSILLRGDGGVLVMPTGSVTARGGLPNGSPAPPPIANGAPGYIRFDAWGAAPVIQGTVDPPATELALPHLRSPSPPQIGTTWTLDVLAPENAPVVVSVSLRPGAGTPTPFGLLGIDLAVASTIGVTTAQPSHDPIASLAIPVPNAPPLIGLPLWSQGLVVPLALPARLTNAVAVTIQ